jgi:dGTPase
LSALLYNPSDFERESGAPDPPDAPWRRPFARDYARVIHSASFRRLQGKTQVFPGNESDFFRNRLMKGEKLLDLIMQMLEQEFGIAGGHMFLLMQLLQKFLACLKLDFI